MSLPFVACRSPHSSSCGAEIQPVRTRSRATLLALAVLPLVAAVVVTLMVIDVRHQMATFQSSTSAATRRLFDDMSPFRNRRQLYSGLRPSSMLPSAGRSSTTHSVLDGILAHLGRASDASSEGDSEDWAEDFLGIGPEPAEGAKLTVVVARLAGGSGEICEGEDWRGQLPRHMAFRLPHAIVLAWTNARNIYETPRCRVCGSEGLHTEVFDCDLWMNFHGRSADALLLVGSGLQFTEAQLRRINDTTYYDDILREHADKFPKGYHSYPDIMYVLQKPWVRPDTRTAHIPVSKIYDDGMDWNVFDRVVMDSAFPKPGSALAAASLRGCASGPKKNVLLYIARLASPEHDHKGQHHFISHVPAEALKGFEVHFFGSFLHPSHVEPLRTTAAARGLRISVKDQVSHEDLLTEICQAKGVVMSTRKDLNPRVAYEGLPAGNLLYVSDEAGVSEELRGLKGVFMESAYTKEYNVFKEYMAAARAADQSYFEEVKRASKELLDPLRAYEQLCNDLGFCNYFTGKGETVAGKPVGVLR